MAVSRSGEIGFALGTAVIGAVLFAQATQIRTLINQPIGSRDYPLLATGILALLAIAVVAQALWGWVHPRRDTNHEAGSVQPIDTSPDSTSDNFDRFAPLGFLALTVLYATGLVFVGFYVSTFAFLSSASAMIGWRSQEEHLGRKLVLVYLPFALSCVVLLYVTVRVLWIYLPDAPLLF